MPQCNRHHHKPEISTIVSIKSFVLLPQKSIGVMQMLKEDFENKHKPIAVFKEKIPPSKQASIKKMEVDIIAIYFIRNKIERAIESERFEELKSRLLAKGYADKRITPVIIDVTCGKNTRQLSHEAKIKIEKIISA